MKIRVRFGIQAMPIFPNLGVFVIYMTAEKFQELQGYVDDARGVLTFAGYAAISNRIICEKSL